MCGLLLHDIDIIRPDAGSFNVPIGICRMR